MDISRTTFAGKCKSSWDVENCWDAELGWLAAHTLHMPWNTKHVPSVSRVSVPQVYFFLFSSAASLPPSFCFASASFSAVVIVSKARHVAYSLHDSDAQQEWNV